MQDHEMYVGYVRCEGVCLHRANPLQFLITFFYVTLASRAPSREIITRISLLMQHKRYKVSIAKIMCTHMPNIGGSTV